MRHLASIFLAFSIALICSPGLSAQHVAPTQTGEPDYKVEITKYEIQRLKEGLFKDATSFTPLERAILWSHLGNLLWKVDEAGARQMLEKSVEEIEAKVKQKNTGNDAQAEQEQLVDATRIVLRTVSAHDRKLSERLLEILSGLKDETRKSADYRSDNIAEALVDSALLVLDKDAKRAVRLAFLSLKYGESSKFSLLLINLRKENRQAADGLFNEALAVAQATRSANLLLALTYAAFPAASDSSIEAPPDTLRIALLKSLAAGVMQEDQTGESAHCQYSTIIARLLGEVDRLLPQQAGIIRSAVMKCQAKSLHVEEAVSSAPPKTVDEFLDAARKSPTIERRAFTLIRASQIAAQQQDFEKAISILDNLTSEERQTLGDTWEMMRRDVTTEAALSYYLRNDLTDLRGVLPSLLAHH